MKRIFLAVMALSLFSISFVNAQENKKTSDFKKWQVRLRGVWVDPSESAKIDIIGGDASVSTSFIPELDFTYFFTEHVSAELILGTTKHDVHTVGSDISAIGGPTSFDVDLGSVYLLPPTLTAQYHFIIADVFRPYIGAGVNYTIFYNVDEGSVVKGVKYDNAFGYAFQGGFDLMVSDKYFINIDCKKLILNTKVKVDASNLAAGLEIPADVDLNPWLVGFGVGMKF